MHQKKLLENMELLLYAFIMKDPNVLFTEQSVWNTGFPSLLSESLSFCVSESGHFYTLPGYEVSREYFNSFLLLYTLKGTGIIETGGQSFTTAPGTLSLIDCHKPHTYKNSGNNWEFLWIHYSGSSSLIYSSLLTDLSASFMVYESGHTEDIINEIISLTGQGDNLSLLRIDLLMTELFYSLAGQLYASSSGPDTDALVRNVAAYIRDHYSENLTVNELAEIFNISPYHLIHSFKKNMGLPPYNYLTNHRIAEAKKMLVLSSDPVGEIAEKCGFSDSAGFIACFKSRTGQTPLQYRKDYRS